MQTKKVTWKDKDNIVRGIVSFQYPKLKGNTKGIARTNKVPQNAMKEYMAHENVERIRESTLDFIDSKMFYHNKDQLYWKTTCKVTYNKNNIISIYMQVGFIIRRITAIHLI